MGLPPKKSESEVYRDAARRLDRTCDIQRVGPVFRECLAWFLAFAVSFGLGLFTFAALVAVFGWPPLAAKITAFLLHLVFVVVSHYYFHELLRPKHPPWWRTFMLVALVILGLCVFALAYARIMVFTEGYEWAAWVTLILTTLLALLEVALALLVAMVTLQASLSAHLAKFLAQQSEELKNALSISQDCPGTWQLTREQVVKDIDEVVTHPDLSALARSERIKPLEDWLDKLDRFHPIPSKLKGRESGESQ